jgi:WhiB family transcriptional regulator, redox-sensing transcriptional regulator
MLPRIRQQVAATAALPCQSYPDLFFSDSPGELRLAQALCAHCPLRGACLAGALQRGEPWGVWGGELFENGQIVAGKRPRGRPRKSGVAA